MQGLFRYEGDLGQWWACIEETDGPQRRITQAEYEAFGIQPYFEDLPLEADWLYNKNHGKS